jgi:hypothetical protein
MRSLSLLMLPLPLLAACEMELSIDQGHQEFDEPIEAVVIEIDTGEVQVFGADIEGAAMDWAFQWRKGCPAADSYVEDGVLYIEAHCPPGAWACQTDFQLHVPAGIPVEALVTTGSIQLDQVGAVRAELTTGEIDIEGAAGELEMSVTTGGIHAYELQADTVFAEVTTGSIDLGLEAPFEQVDAKLITGEIAMEVPEGCYDLDLDVVTGGISTTGVSCDCDAAAGIRAEVVTGSIDIRGEW